MKMNPYIRIVHANLPYSLSLQFLGLRKVTYPTLGSKVLESIGMMVPPRDDPIATIPIEIPLFSLNQCATTAGVGPKRHPQEIYMHVHKIL
jgi:hypothetical protein